MILPSLMEVSVLVSGEKEQDGLKCAAMVHPEVPCEPTMGHVHQWGRSMQLCLKPSTHSFLFSLLAMLIFVTLKRTT